MLPRLLAPVRRAIPLSLVLAAVAAPSCGRTVAERPDGNGDAPTIQAAIDAAAPGDTIRIGPGTYSGPGNRDLEFHGKAVVLIGTAGPAATVIDCGGAPGDPHRGAYFHEGEGPGSVLAGFTITNGYVEGKLPANYGGGILCVGSSPTIRDCWIVGNRSDHFGGGMVCYMRASPTLERIRFVSNSAVNNGGGFGSKSFSAPVLREVLFARNVAKRGGGLWSWNATTRIERATFCGNEASDFGGAVWASQADMEITRSILGFSTKGGAIVCSTGQPEVRISCCDLFGNAGGDSLDAAVDGGGNFSADPMFCDSAAGNYALKEQSPCAPGRHPGGRQCGWIGAMSGCDATGPGPK